MTMDSRVLLVLCLLCGLEVDSQTFPRLSYGRDDPIPNHGYVDLGTVGVNWHNSVRCITDLTTCCRSEEGDHRGQWFFPNGTLVTQSDNTDFYVRERERRTDLQRRNDATLPTGIYRCKIPTNAVHDDTDTSVGESVYVGLYTSEGKWLRYIANTTNRSVCFIP